MKGDTTKRVIRRIVSLEDRIGKLERELQQALALNREKARKAGLLETEEA